MRKPPPSEQQGLCDSLPSDTNRPVDQPAAIGRTPANRHEKTSSTTARMHPCIAPKTPPPKISGGIAVAHPGSSPRSHLPIFRPTLARDGWLIALVSKIETSCLSCSSYLSLLKLPWSRCPRRFPWTVTLEVTSRRLLFAPSLSFLC